ncbi:ABC transporter ATP-binding protein [Pseudarthrobacter sp. NKDBFgelt]|uniref:ABC transporter ATP-binding protein n=1 Tax=Pseudarthrobacter sp. NKDBFgelt TaxID=3384443 RepID=UPI0038D5006C
MTTTSIRGAKTEAREGAVGVLGVSKRYGGARAAVDNLTLHIEAGEFLTLLGPSGCGKTTTLRMIGGFENPDTGTIVIDGQDVSKVPPFRRPVNTVFQQYALFPHLDVAGNIGYGLHHSGVRGAAKRHQVQSMLELMDIQGLEKRRPAQLSGGQQQRVALARALVMRPKVLLLDEPLGALDYRLRQSMQLELRRIHREVGTTFVFVTHDQEEAMTMSDRICVMRNGQIEQIAPPNEIYDRPSTAFVAGFVGSTNLLEGKIVSGSADAGKVHVPGIGTLNGTAPSTTVQGSTASVSLRPEHLNVQADIAGNGVVTEVVLSGSYFTVVVQLDGQLLKVQAGRNNLVRPGTRVTITADERWVRILPKAAA